MGQAGRGIHARTLNRVRRAEQDGGPLGGAAVLRIGIDYRPAVSHAPGVGRYARELVRALVRLDDAPELALLEIGRAPAAVPESALGLQGIGDRARRLSRPWPRRAVDLLGRVGFGADRLAGGVDLFHQVRLPLLRVSRAPWTVALSELPPEGSASEASLSRELQGAAAVLVASEHFADEVTRRLGVAPGCVRRVPVGCDHWARELTEPPPRADPALVLVLGAPGPQRRPELILEAVEALHRGGRRCRLHFAGAGSGGAFAERLARSTLGGAVSWDLPGEDRLPGIVASASVLVHLNDEEGTPVTPLEAFAVGTPVVASRIAAFEEALSGLATLLDTPPVADGGSFVDVLADAIDRAIEDAATGRGEAARRALARSFPWSAAAARTLEVWRELLAHDGCHSPR